MLWRRKIRLGCEAREPRPDPRPQLVEGLPPDERAAVHAARRRRALAPDLCPPGHVRGTHRDPVPRDVRVVASRGERHRLVPLRAALRRPLRPLRPRPPLLIRLLRPLRTVRGFLPWRHLLIAVRVRHHSLPVVLGRRRPVPPLRPLRRRPLALVGILRPRTAIRTRRPTIRHRLVPLRRCVCHRPSSTIVEWWAGNGGGPPPAPWGNGLRWHPCPMPPRPSLVGHRSPLWHHCQ